MQTDSTILVTGASGFIGAHLCEHLVRQGRRVIGVAREHPERLPSGVTARTADLSRPEECDRLLQDLRPETIFHLASHVAGSRDLRLVRPTFDANLAAAVNLMLSAAAQGCGRFVMTGSLEEPDSVHAAPSSPYAAAKAAAASYGRMFHALYGLPVVIARVFMVYGPDQRDPHKLVPYVIESLLHKRAPRLSSGTRPVDWVYVADVAEGLALLAAADGVAGQTVDIGSGELETVRGVVERLARLFPDAEPPIFDPAADRPMEQVRRADVARTVALTGWRPRTTLDAGLRATVEWHRRRLTGPAGGAAS